MSEVEVAEARRLRWWKELLFVLVFYGLYSLARNQFGSARVDLGQAPENAFNNALRVIDFERRLHLFHEQTIQSWFVPATGVWVHFIRFWNVYYGTFHFVVTGVAFIWMFVRTPARFVRWRNTLAFTTALAIVGFSLFPLMPPRLLDQPADRYGGAQLAADRDLPPFGFVDTLEVYGGLWSFGSGTMKEISNQYAAMPSLHIAWSTWCAFAMWPLVRRRWAKTLLVLYPIATLFCIIVTANHYWLDGMGGLIALGTGALLGHWLDIWWQGRIARKASERETVAA